MEEENSNKQVIDIRTIVKNLWTKRKTFVLVWIATFVLSCIWILPQPRYYTCDVSVAPESSSGDTGGGLSSLASSFGINIGSSESSDAIYPELYPELFSSTDFLVDLLDIKVTTEDGTVKTDYYDYLKNYQQKNPLTFPFRFVGNQIKKLFKKPEPSIPGKNGKRFDPFHLNMDVDGILKQVSDNILCDYSKTTSVITISVTDQDPVVCATLADSVKGHLQDFITEYRTKKARIDLEHYKKMTAEAKAQYDKARQRYASFADSDMEVTLESVKAKQDDLENEMQLKYNVYTAMQARLEDAQEKVQERTPAFTTLKCATVPIKPAGPKRVIFVLVMLILSTFATSGWIYRKELEEWF